MIPLIFLLGLLVLLWLLHRSGKRGRKLNETIETNRDLRNELEIRRIEEDNLELSKQLTGSSDIRQDTQDG